MRLNAKSWKDCFNEALLVNMVMLIEFRVSKNRKNLQEKTCSMNELSEGLGIDLLKGFPKL